MGIQPEKREKNDMGEPNIGAIPTTLFSKAAYICQVVRNNGICRVMQGQQSWPLLRPGFLFAYLPLYKKSQVVLHHLLARGPVSIQHDSALCPQNLVLLLTSSVTSHNLMVLNINILMTSKYQPLMQASPLNTDPYSTLPPRCVRLNIHLPSQTQQILHTNAWFPFPIGYFLSQ